MDNTLNDNELELVNALKSSIICNIDMWIGDTKEIEHELSQLDFDEIVKFNGIGIIEDLIKCKLILRSSNNKLQPVRIQRITVLQNAVSMKVKYVMLHELPESYQSLISKRKHFTPCIMFIS